jgi:hypothetical protein
MALKFSLSGILSGADGIDLEQYQSVNFNGLKNEDIYNF